MSLARISRIAGLSSLVFALVLSVSGAARADLAKWDQARVTSIAQQLVPAAQAWELAARQQGPGTIGAAEEQGSLPMKARTLREMSEGLADHLAKGEGHDKTLDQYKSMREVADDTEEMAQRSELQAPTIAAWSKIADLLRQIAPYYDPKALTGDK